jgi:hypothetical protein
MRYSLLLLVLFTGLVQAAVYKTVTESGEVTYSDTPGPGAERVRLPELPTYTPPPLPKITASPEKQPVKSMYNNMTITQPEAEATVRSNQGMVQISIELDPPLMTRLGHRVQFYLDDERHGSPVENMAIGFSNIHRGTHDISAYVIDKDDNPVMSASAVTFHLQRESIFNPQNPNNPNNKPKPTPLPIVKPKPTPAP